LASHPETVQATKIIQSHPASSGFENSTFYSKWPKPQDVARVILFLCGDDAKLIHGASIQV